MFGWVDHAAALDGFLFRYAVCPLCLSSSVVVCRLSSSSVARLLCPYCRQQWGLGRRWSRKDSLARVGRTNTVLGRAFVCSTPAVVGRTNMQWGVGRRSVTR